jgi:hypothetical protein
MNFILPLQSTSPASLVFQFLDDLAKGSNEKVIEIVDNITPNLQAFAVVLFSIYVAYRLLSAWIKPGEPIHPTTLVRPIVILAAMSLYKPLVEILLLTPTELLSGIVSEGVGNATDGTRNLQLTRATAAMGEIKDGGIWDILAFNPFLELAHFLLYIASTVVISYMLIRQLILKSLYFVLGIFVLPLSLIPSNEKALTKWFMGFLSILLWVPILDIMMALIISVDLKAEGSAIFGVSPVLTVVIQIIYIFLLLKVPTFANILVGGEGSASGAGLKTAKNALINSKIYGGGSKK